MPMPRSLRRFRSLCLVVIGSCLFAGLGYAAALTMAPSRDGDSAAPPSGPVTSSVESRHLRSAVVVRGDAAFSDPVKVTVRTDAPLPIVTRTPPRVGAQLDPGDVLLEVVGRPVIALTGDLPPYRDLGPGAVGPDVAQLERALAAIGLDPGTVDDEYTSVTASAVEELYERLGYEPPSASSGEDGTGDESAPGDVPDDAERPGGPDRSDPVEEVVLPMSEVTYVPSLPRRVDRSSARRGRPLPEVPMILSGSELVISVDLTVADLEILETRMRVRVEVPGQRPVRGTLGTVEPTATGGRTMVRLPYLTPRQEGALRGANVKVTVPLQATSGKVLVVPLAALSTDASGQVRVVKVHEDQSTTVVEVELGLSAEGYAEVRSREGELVDGDRVVVGE